LVGRVTWVWGTRLLETHTIDGFAGAPFFGGETNLRRGPRGNVNPRRRIEGRGEDLKKRGEWAVGNFLRLSIDGTEETRKQPEKETNAKIKSASLLHD